MGASHNRSCVECGTAFVAQRPEAMYCCRRCKAKRDRRERDPAKKAAEFARWRAKNPARWNETRKASYQRRRALKRGANGERVVSSRVFDACGWVCGLCGRQVDPALPWPDPMSASLDHVVPLAKGGSHSYANVQLAHLTCNVRKGASAA